MARPPDLLLDTCAAIWLVAGAPLEPKALDAIEANGRRGGALFVSAISAWEVAMLAQRGRIRLNVPAQAWFERLASLPGLAIQPLAPEILVASTELPDFPHKDPADRMIAATARAMGLTVVTRDRPLLDYGRRGRIRAMAC